MPNKNHSPEKSRNPFERFIETLESLNHLPKKLRDKDAEFVDEALAKWLATYYPDFDFNPKIRDWTVRIFKESKKITLNIPYMYMLMLCLTGFTRNPKTT